MWLLYSLRNICIPIPCCGDQKSPHIWYLELEITEIRIWWFGMQLSVRRISKQTILLDSEIKFLESICSKSPNSIPPYHTAMQSAKQLLLSKSMYRVVRENPMGITRLLKRTGDWSCRCAGPPGWSAIAASHRREPHSRDRAAVPDEYPICRSQLLGD